jgi:hypothetical protein
VEGAARCGRPKAPKKTMRIWKAFDHNDFNWLILCFEFSFSLQFEKLIAYSMWRLERTACAWSRNLTSPGLGTWLPNAHGERRIALWSSGRRRWGVWPRPAGWGANELWLGRAERTPPAELSSFARPWSETATREICGVQCRADVRKNAQDCTKRPTLTHLDPLVGSAGPGSRRESPCCMSFARGQIGRPFVSRRIDDC